MPPMLAAQMAPRFPPTPPNFMPPVPPMGVSQQQPFMNSTQGVVNNQMNQSFNAFNNQQTSMMLQNRLKQPQNNMSGEQSYQPPTYY